MYEDRAKAAHDMMRGIVERYGPRLPGSEASLKAASELEAAAALAGDKAGSETFTLHPGAFLGYIRVNINQDSLRHLEGENYAILNRV